MLVFSVDVRSNVRRIQNDQSAITRRTRSSAGKSSESKNGSTTKFSFSAFSQPTRKVSQRNESFKLKAPFYRTISAGRIGNFLVLSLQGDLQTRRFVYIRETTVSRKKTRRFPRRLMTNSRTISNRFPLLKHRTSALGNNRSGRIHRFSMQNYW